MKKIVIKDNFAFVYLNSNFYTKASIISALDVYKDFFKANLAENLGKYSVVKIEKINDDFSLEELANEFLNYVLSNEHQQGDGD